MHAIPDNPAADGGATSAAANTAAPAAAGSERAIERLLAHYADSHQNPQNEIIHCICVPAIVWSFLAGLWAIHPLVAIVATAIAQIYYFRLSTAFGVGMLVMTLGFLASLALMPSALILPLAIGVFVVSWIGQFIGHKIEGKKPSFFDDLRYLLIGPLFVLGLLFRRLRVGY